jgi:hypothetical protein
MILSPQTVDVTSRQISPDNERAARIRREIASIASAESELSAGLGIEFEVAEAWLDALEHDPHSPLPIAKPSAPKP